MSFILKSTHTSQGILCHFSWCWHGEWWLTFFYFLLTLSHSTSFHCWPFFSRTMLMEIGLQTACLQVFREISGDQTYNVRDASFTCLTTAVTAPFFSPGPLQIMWPSYYRLLHTLNLWMWASNKTFLQKTEATNCIWKLVISIRVTVFMFHSCRDKRGRAALVEINEAEFGGQGQHDWKIPCLPIQKDSFAPY